MSLREITQKAEAKMKKSVESFQHEIAAIRTGKATTALLDRVKVDAYGQTMPLKQIGNVGVQDAHTLRTNQWSQGRKKPYGMPISALIP